MRKINVALFLLTLTFSMLGFSSQPAKCTKADVISAISQMTFVDTKNISDDSRFGEDLPLDSVDAGCSLASEYYMTLPGYINMYCQTRLGCPSFRRGRTVGQLLHKLHLE